CWGGGGPPPELITWIKPAKAATPAETASATAPARRARLGATGRFTSAAGSNPLRATESFGSADGETPASGVRNAPDRVFRPGGMEFLSMRMVETGPFPPFQRFPDCIAGQGKMHEKWDSAGNPGAGFHLVEEIRRCRPPPRPSRPGWQVGHGEAARSRLKATAVHLPATRQPAAQEYLRSGGFLAGRLQGSQNAVL
ncbi:hypothetical protein, partial [Methanocorpusculum sp. GPch4]|uniref:hypothetical protein n=1 Tax=Methanocorpusculum sp. GPch4 TaxID=2527877 RepID=UPI001ADE4907